MSDAFNIRVNVAEFNAEVIGEIESIMPRLHMVIGNEFLDMSRENFIYASSRPEAWPALSPRYARKVGRSEATLYESGRLFQGFTMTADAQKATVENPVEYAAAHQYGYPQRNLPARPYMPVLGEDLTPYAKARIERRVEAELEKL